MCLAVHQRSIGLHYAPFSDVTIRFGNQCRSLGYGDDVPTKVSKYIYIFGNIFNIFFNFFYTRLK